MYNRVTSNTKKREVFPFSNKFNYFCITMYKELTSEQRYAIFVNLKKHVSQKDIAERIGVSPATVSREIKRNSTSNGEYIWDKAQKMADARKYRTPYRKTSEELVLRIKEMIKTEHLSPRQISSRLAKLEGIKISHQTIYKIIRADETGDLAEHCRHRKK